MQNLNMQTPDGVQKNIEKIAQLFPHLIVEKKDDDGKMIKAIDFDLFKQNFSDELVEGYEERYRLDWPGKKESLLFANKSIDKTLRPVREDSVNFDTTKNLYIEGDNFEVLKILQESYLGKVKMIYIDPPYNTGQDFMYKDNYKLSKEEYEEELGIVGDDGGKLVKNTDTNGRFHSDWLSMMYERLYVARDLLKDDGVIFISIDDNEVSNLRKICDEIFGEENFINCICINMSNLSGPKIQHAIMGRRFPKIKEYILLYVKNKDKYNLKIPKVQKKCWDNEYNLIIPEIDKNFFNKKDNLTTFDLNKEIKKYSLLSLSDYIKDNNIQNEMEWKYENAYRIFSSKPNTALLNKAKEKEFYDSQIYCLENQSGDNKLIKTDFNRETRTARIELLPAQEKLEVFLGDHWGDIVTTGGIGGEGNVAYPNAKKPLKLIGRLLDTVIDNNDIVLDFFSGSATTAHAVMEKNFQNNLNCSYIMVQIAEDLDKAYIEATGDNKIDIDVSIKFLDDINKKHCITEIGKERIRRAGKKILEDNKDKEGIENLDIGFRVYKVDSTNMKDVFYHPEELVQQQLINATSNIKEDRTPEDILTQVILDLGLTLDMSIEAKKIGENTVYFVDNNSLVACFDDDIDSKIIEEMAKINPLRIVLKDSSFKNDADKINFENKFKGISPDTEIKVL